MGRTASSSKPKSSIKKKSKLSSKTRRKKTSKRNKSKRVYSDDSVSWYSDESSYSISSSDSEDGYIGRKGRSRVRDKVKSGKKRVRRSPSSDDSDGDVKVRKRSKRSGDSKVRKKTHKKKKKKSRRKVSVSSSSSDSGILRTRRHDSPSDSEESEHERKRGRSKKRKKDNTSSGRIRDKKRKLRSRSCSSCSRYSDDNDDVIKDKVVSEIDQNRDIVTSEILPRRLKSVITVVQPHYEEDVTGQDMDENKEEIFYDQDDYPSCRSNDSNDGVRKDLAHHKSYVESEMERAENMVGEEVFASEFVVKESKLSSGDRIDQSDRTTLKRSGNKNEIDTSTTTAGSGTEDLETILRQKALENLMRFRGPHRNAKPPSHHEDNNERIVKSFTAKADDVQNRSSKHELSSGVGETGGRNQNSRQTVRTNSSCFVQTDEMKLAGRDSEIESSTANHRVVHPSAGVKISGKSEFSTSPLMEQMRGNSLEQVPLSPLSAHVQGTLPAPMNVTHKSAAEKAETLAGSIGDNQNVGVIDASVAPESSSIKLISEEHNSKPQDESKGNSFEQKTMSVMRGGEMVQVSYKVYIPNKAPALARRKLQR